MNTDLPYRVNVRILATRVNVLMREGGNQGYLSPVRAVSFILRESVRKTICYLSPEMQSKATIVYQKGEE